MDLYDYLFKIKIQFYLGQSKEVLSLWMNLEKSLDRNSPEFESQSNHYLEILVFGHRTLFTLAQQDPSVLEENKSLLAKHGATVNLYLEYLELSSDESLNTSTAEEGLQKLADMDNDSLGKLEKEFLILSRKVLHNYLAFRARLFDRLAQPDKKYVETYMDYLMLKFQAFSIYNQVKYFFKLKLIYIIINLLKLFKIKTKEAERVYENMKAENDEHILVGFCEFEIENRFKRNHEEALAVVLEMKQKFGESPKLINLNAAALILKKDFFKVHIDIKK